MADYRWGRASGGDIPADACENGHGWRWGDTEDGGQKEVPQWLARSLPGADGEVRLGYVERGKPARLGPEGSEQPVDEYEVLLDKGEWASPEPIDTEDDLYLDFVAAGGLACGRLADGTPLYATVRDREGEGYAPGENPGRRGMDFNRKVLVVGPDTAPAPSAPAESGAAEPAGAEAQPAGPVAVISALDLRSEVVEISNTGGAPLDLGGWRLHDEGSGKGYVFPKGTTVAVGGSVRVRTGPSAAKPGPGELAWKTASVWNDQGDTAYLEDPAGTLISSRKG